MGNVFARSSRGPWWRVDSNHLPCETEGVLKRIFVRCPIDTGCQWHAPPRRLRGLEGARRARRGSALFEMRFGKCASANRYLEGRYFRVGADMDPSEFVS